MLRVVLESLNALQQKTSLRHADYNFGRAEMLLGEDAAALEHFPCATR
jgi:hypothetical protein